MTISVKYAIILLRRNIKKVNIIIQILIALVLILNSVIHTERSFDNRITIHQENRLNANTYRPPSHCATQVQTSGQIVVLYVEGKNSSIFCRRVLTSLPTYMNALETQYIFEANRPEPTCTIQGEGFKISVVSDDRFGKAICNMLSDSL